MKERITKNIYTHTVARSLTSVTDEPIFEKRNGNFRYEKKGKRKTTEKNMNLAH